MTITEFLEARITELRAEYARVGAPLLNAIAETQEHLRGIRRERGELFYVEYMHYWRKETEECDDLEDAKGYAAALEDSGNGVVRRIYGAGVELPESEWDAE